MKKTPFVLLAAAAILMSCVAPVISTPQVAHPGSTVEFDAPADPPAVDTASPGDLSVLLAIWRDVDDGGSLHQVDARTGTDLPEHDPIFLGGNYWHALSPDDRHLMLGGWSNVAWTDVMDLQDFEVKAELPMLDLTNLEAVDGEPWLVFCSSATGETTRVAMLNTDSWGVAREWTVPGYAQVWHAWGGPAP